MMSGLADSSYNVQDEDEYTEKQVNAILAGIELIESRIRFNLAFLDFLNTCSTDEFITSLSKQLAPFLLLNQTADLGLKINKLDQNSNIIIPEILDHYKEATNSDIDFLKNTHNILKNSLNDRDYILKLCALLSKNEFEESKHTDELALFNKAEDDALNAISKLKKSAKKDKKDTTIADKLKNAEQKYKDIKEQKKQFIQQIPNMSELKTIQDLRSILLGGLVIRTIENNYDKHIITKLQNGQITATYSKKHIQLLDDNKKILSELIEYCAAITLELEKISPDFNTTFRAFDIQCKLIEITTLFNKYFNFSSSDLDDFLAGYRFNYNFKLTANEFKNSITEYYNSQKAWVDLQVKLSKERQIEQELALAEQIKQEKDKKQQILAEQKIQLQQQELKKIQESKQQRNQELENWLKSVEEQRQINLQAKKQRLQKMIDSSERNLADDAYNIVNPCYIVPQELIEKNVATLEELFDPKTKTITYLKAVTLIEALGGKVDVSTGSSHQKIIFSGHVVQDLQVDNQNVEMKSVAGIAKPHARKTDIRNHNLKLLRGALRSVLPAEFFLALDDRKPKPRPLF